MKKYEHQQAEIRRHKENFIGLPVRKNKHKLQVYKERHLDT